MDEHSIFGKILKDIATDGGFDSLSELMNRLSREQAYGSKDSIFADLLYGFNRRLQGNMVPANSDQQGLTFITRPNLNLSYDNITMVRCLTPLLTRDPRTLQSAVRAMLDPDAERKRGEGAPGLIDNRQAFLPLLTNSLISCSGWPDIGVHAYNSGEGLAKEVWMMNDSIPDVNNYYELTCTFQNMLGDPITLLFHVWLRYMGAVYTGLMTAKPYCIVEREIDYNTRIYRLVLDYSGRYVQKIAACGAAMPLSLSIGSAFNFSRDQPFTEELHQITVPFGCVGAQYNDPITLYEFNRVGELFNPALRDNPSQFTVIPFAERNLFNYVGFPRIDMKTNELQWWVDNDDYQNYRKGTIKTRVS